MRGSQDCVVLLNEGREASRAYERVSKSRIVDCELDILRLHPRTRLFTHFIILYILAVEGGVLSRQANDIEVHGW